jgi:hypothetical protein
VAEDRYELLEWRVHQLELVEAALRTELHDQRTERDARLKDDYMTREQLKNMFVTRAELAARGRERREWLPIAIAVFFGIPSVTSTILLITQGH